MSNNSAYKPAYLNLLETCQFPQRIALAQDMLRACSCCGWACKVDRLAGVMGVCKTGVAPRVSSYGAHLGEEKPLRGWRGSGTIFFSRCNMRCQFCQNADISQSDSGSDVDAARLAEIMLELQFEGCHNINFVSPTHVLAPIIAAVYLAAQGGLHIPLVYNTGGYDSEQALVLLDGIIDIYMPDMKYANAQVARRYSRIPNYPQVNQQAVRLMYRQVGDLHIRSNGLATRGLLVRHLVLPNNLAGTQEIMRFLAQEISLNTYVNIMDQYHPAYRSNEYPQINRHIKTEEILLAFQAARDAGLHRLDHEM